MKTSSIRYGRLITGFFSILIVAYLSYGSVNEYLRQEKFGYNLATAAILNQSDQIIAKATLSFRSATRSVDILRPHEIFLFETLPDDWRNGDIVAKVQFIDGTTLICTSDAPLQGDSRKTLFHVTGKDEIYFVNWVNHHKEKVQKLVPEPCSPEQREGTSQE
ncbi:MAG: hypothetical protein HWE25_00490 [Alphaproteobacteria bacterium]|nr:hypothetical protein [Alphaproteobacteria bacterium]